MSDNGTTDLIWLYKNNVSMTKYGTLAVFKLKKDNEKTFEFAQFYTVCCRKTEMLKFSRHQQAKQNQESNMEPIRDMHFKI